MTSSKHELKVQKRTVSGRKVKRLRTQGILPGSIFGKNIASQNIQLDSKQFSHIFSQTGESSLIYLQLDTEKTTRPVFISQLTKNPVTDLILHVTFHQVDLKEKVTAPVPVVLVGEPLAEKEKLGIMVQQADEIEVEALPTDMPENIQIDVTGLADVGAAITVKDIRIDTSKLLIKTDPDTIVVQITALAKEEVAPVVETPVETEAEAAATAAAEPGVAPAPAPAKEPAPKA